MKSKYHILKDKLKNADTMYKLGKVADEIEEAWFKIESKTESEVMLNKKVIKWGNLYDEACEKSKILSRKFSKLLDKLNK